MNVIYSASVLFTTPFKEGVVSNSVPILGTSAQHESINDFVDACIYQVEQFKNYRSYSEKSISAIACKIDMDTGGLEQIGSKTVHF